MAGLRSLITQRPRLAKLALTVWERFDWFLPTEPDFEVFGWLRLRPGCFLDVGAHVGESARSFRKFCKTTNIVSIEANAESYTKLVQLEKRLRDFTSKHLMASDKERRLSYVVPSIDGVPFPSLGGENVERIKQRIQRNWGIAKDERVTFAESYQDAIPLDRLELQPAVIKLDIEGHERQALRGLRRTVERHLPIILLEIEMEDIWGITNDLNPCTYTCLVYDHESKNFRAFKPGDPHTSQNAWFVPKRDLSKFPMHEGS